MKIDTAEVELKAKDVDKIKENIFLKEIVRCMDCVKRYDGCPMQVWCGTDDDDYCSRGVRDD